MKSNETSPYRLIVPDAKNLKAINVDNCQILKPSTSLSSELSIPLYILDIYNHWIDVANTKYYYKKTRAATRIVLEFLGEYISKYMELETVEYTLAVDKKGISGLLSENYREKDIDYIQSYQLSQSELSQIIRRLSMPYLYSKDQLEEELAKYIMRNFYTSSGDRDGNVLCKRIDGKLHLAILYDYECSFDSYGREVYIDKLFRKKDDNYILIDYNYIAKLVKKSKIMQQYFERIMDLNMNGILSEIEEENGFIIPLNLKDRLKNYDKDRKRLMMQNKSIF